MTHERGPSFPGPGPGPRPTTTIAVASITLTPSTVQAGQDTVIEVTAVSRAPPDGAPVSLSSRDVNQPFGSVIKIPLPADLPIEATAGGVTKVATLHIVP